MKLRPDDYDIPADYQHWHGDRAEDFLGPFFFRVEADSIDTAFRVEARHCNAHASLHGGVMMAFADYTLCLAANGGTQQSVATVTCNNEFVAPAHEGDLAAAQQAGLDACHIKGGIDAWRQANGPLTTPT